MLIRGDQITRALVGSKPPKPYLNTLRQPRHPRPDDRSGRRAVTYPTGMPRKRLGP